MLLLLACTSIDDVHSLHGGSSGPTGWDLELRALDEALAEHQVLADQHPDDWTRRATVAGLYKQRARLTGGYADYVKAEAWLDDAFDVAPEGSGPLMQRAGLNYTLHRLSRVEADVATAEQAILIDDIDASGFALTRGLVTWQSGDMDAGLALLKEAHELHPTIETEFALALDAWRRGDFDDAERRFRKAEGDLVVAEREPYAWVDLQLGIMDLERGRYDDAMSHYRDADEHLGGYWLIEEHIAEIHVLQGRPGEAVAIYLDVIERTGSPEFMAAMAGIQPDAGWEKQAAAVYAEQLTLFPESAAGHALAFELEFGTPQQALALAELNFASRPNPEARELLAVALLANDRPAEALEVLTPALESPWVTASLFAAAAEVYDANGLDGSAWQARALEINPRILD